eukprot:g12726.t1
MMASVVGQYGRAIKFDYSPWPNVLTWVNLTTKRPAFYPPRGMKVNPKGEAPKGNNKKNYCSLSAVIKIVVISVPLALENKN